VQAAGKARRREGRRRQAPDARLGLGLGPPKDMGDNRGGQAAPMIAVLTASARSLRKTGEGAARSGDRSNPDAKRPLVSGLRRSARRSPFSVLFLFYARSSSVSGSDGLGSSFAFLRERVAARLSLVAALFASSPSTNSRFTTASF